MNATKATYLVVLFLLLCGCHFPNPDTENFTQIKPDNQDLVGTYLPTAETTKWVREERKYPNVETSFVLSKDGSFQMINIPDCWGEAFGKGSGGFKSGSGQWEVTKEQNSWELKLEFKSGLALTTWINIVGKSAPYSLWFYVGDPDQGDVMILEKKRK